MITFKDHSDVGYIQHMGSDQIIADAAWVSTKGFTELVEEHDEDKVRGLIKYLIKMKHGTPFEHGSFTVRIHAPIFVWREFHRHRIGFSYNEESARYHKLEPVFYVPPGKRPMFKVDDWKPGRPKFLMIEETEDPKDSINRYNKLWDNLKDDYERSYAHYEENLEMGFDPGLARDGLPVGIFSACWVTCNPRSIMAFLSLRTHDPDAQHVSYPLYEIEQVALRLEEIFKRHWPITHRAFCDNKRVAP